jgi:hypothetical protein
VPLSQEDTDYIRHAYMEGVKRGRRDAAAGQAYLGERLEGAIGFSVGCVDKYSPDQTAWASRRLLRDTGRMVKPIAGHFERYFPGGPENGQSWGVGNSFVATGLTNLISLWTALTGARINALSGTGSVCGVGTGTTLPATSDTALISDNGASAWYQAFDNTASFGTTTTNGVLIGTSTFGSANANFAWNEWCWATGGGSITAGTTLSATTNKPFNSANSQAMVNHKTNVALGTKASGSSWVFSTTFTII